MPKQVTATMTKSLRAGKVFLDWSQNSAAKTTIAPYSMRGREQPTVAAPRTWEEIEDPSCGSCASTRCWSASSATATCSERLDESAPLADKLTTYRSMRDAGKTPEPVPRHDVDQRAGQRRHLRHPGAPRPAAALRLPAGTRRRAGVLGGAEEPAGDHVGQSPGGAHRGPPAGVRHLRGLDSQGGVRRRRGHRLGFRHLRDREVPRQPARRSGEGRRGDRHPARLQGLGPLRADPDRRQELAGAPDEGASRSPRRGSGAHARHARIGGATEFASCGHSRASGMATGCWSTPTMGHCSCVRAVAVTSRMNIRNCGRWPPIWPTITSSWTARSSRSTSPACRASVRCRTAAPSSRHRVLGVRRVAARRAISVACQVLRPPTDPGGARRRWRVDRSGAAARRRRRGAGVRQGEQRWEGVVAKKRDSTYQPGRRSSSWIKDKLWSTQEVVIGGWRAGEGGRTSGIGALLSGSPRTGDCTSQAGSGPGSPRRSWRD